MAASSSSVGLDLTLAFHLSAALGHLLRVLGDVAEVDVLRLLLGDPGLVGGGLGSDRPLIEDLPLATGRQTSMLHPLRRSYPCAHAIGPSAWNLSIWVASSPMLRRSHSSSIAACSISSFTSGTR